MVATPRSLNASEVEFKVEIEHEIDGPDFDDAETQAWIEKELDRDNVFAWCWVRVTATWNGLEGEDALGGCSYRNARDLEENLLGDMRANALADLNERLAKFAAEIAERL